MSKKSGMMLGKGSEYRGYIFQGIIVGIFALLVLRLFYLQVIKGDEYRERSNNNRVKLKRVEAPRGKIFDSKGRLLVTNEAGYRLLYLNERRYGDKELEEISNLLGYTDEQVEKRIKYGEIFPYTRENILIEDLPEKEAHKIIEKLSEYPYLEVQTYAKRKYLKDGLASHLLGYVKKISAKEYEKLKDLGYTRRDILGKNGVEKNYDINLQGKAGYEYIEVNALNRIVKKLNKREPIPGKDMYLTIDSELQETIENYYKEKGIEGSFIAVNPKNGEVLTIVSYPTYSLNLLASRFSSEEWNTIMNDKRKPLTNRAIAGEYPPGSVFKPLEALELLKDGVDPNKKYFDIGYYQVGKWKWKPWKRGGHGYVDLNKALVESANPYFYKLGDKLGYQKMVDGAAEFGLGEYTNIDIPGEKPGRLPTMEWKKETLNEPWYRGDTINLSIGQGYLTTTPIQMVEAYSILANKGKAYKLHTVRELDGKQEDIVIPHQIVRDVDRYPTRDYEIVTNALVNTVEQNNGTAKVLRTPGIKVAGKTGSAENPQYEKTHAWAAGYFPARDPEVVFVAFGEGAGGGGSVAAPIAKVFIDKYLEIEKREVLEKEKAGMRE